MWEFGHSVQSAIRTTTNSATNVVGGHPKETEMFIAGILNATLVYPTILHALGGVQDTLNLPRLSGLK